MRGFAGYGILIDIQNWITDRGGGGRDTRGVRSR